jgi:hypothetical protein
VNRQAPRDTHRADMPEAVRRYAALAWLFDQAFRVPGTSWRFGVDGIIGLVPGAGDIVAGLVGTYGIFVARQLGAPLSVQARMLLNLSIDTLVGAIPLLGDLFDFAFKAHLRNRVLLEEWVSRPHRVHRTSILWLVAFVLVILLIVIGAVWIAVITVRAIIQLMS